LLLTTLEYPAGNRAGTLTDLRGACRRRSVMADLVPECPNCGSEERGRAQEARAKVTEVEKAAALAKLTAHERKLLGLSCA
jgi:hypothetical protein